LSHLPQIVEHNDNKMIQNYEIKSHYSRFLVECDRTVEDGLIQHEKGTGEDWVSVRSKV